MFLLFWYQLYCGFSGAVMIDEIYLMIYNLIFTALPPLAIGVYDKKIIDDLLLNYPRLYRHVSIVALGKPTAFQDTKPCIHCFTLGPSGEGL